MRRPKLDFSTAIALLLMGIATSCFETADLYGRAIDCKGARLVPGITSKQSSDCSFPPKDLLQKPRTEYRGEYANEAYEYYVVIPDKLVGYDQPTPPHHGFGIVVGERPQSYITVNGEKNSLEYTAPVDPAIRDLGYLRKHGTKIESAKITQLHLGRLDAAFLVTTYTCAGSADRYVQASAFALSPDNDNLYEVTLYSNADRYDLDRAVLDEILKSWKYTGQ
jgi:hypothetical protein